MQTEGKDQELNKRLAELLGVEPELVEWWAQKGDSVCFSAPYKEDVEEWLKSIRTGSWAKDYVPTPFYRYPNYTTDLNAVHSVVMGLTDDQHNRYRERLYGIKRQDLPTLKFYAMEAAVDATARQRTEALIKTLEEQAGQ